MYYYPKLYFLLHFSNKNESVGILNIIDKIDKMSKTLFISISDQTVPFHMGDSAESVSMILRHAKPNDWCFVNNQPLNTNCVIASIPDDFTNIHSVIQYGINLSKQYSPSNRSPTNSIRFSKVGAI